MKEKIAIVRIRGVRKIKPKIKRTLKLLRLERPNYCVIMDPTSQTIGMLNVANDYIAFGKISREMIYRLLVKRGKKNGVLLSKTLKPKEIESMANEISEGKKVKDFADPIFKLHPPRKGFKDTKRHYPTGELGKREDMDSLVKRMM